MNDESHPHFPHSRPSRDFNLLGIASALLLIGSIIMSTLLAGCSTSATPRPQQGGGVTTTLGGAAGPTSTTATGPDNSQTPSTTTLHRTITRGYLLPATANSPTLATGPQDSTGYRTADATAGGLTARGDPLPPPADTGTNSIATGRVVMSPGVESGTGQSGGAVFFPRDPYGPYLPYQERIDESATTQLGTNQDQATILKSWEAKAIANYRALLWAAGLAAAYFWLRKEWIFIALICVVGAVACLVWSWWAGPLALIACAVAYVAHIKTHLALNVLPKV